MTYRRGASLTNAATLGHADTADREPTAGNGFDTRWPDDLAALHDLGITDVRIALDWSRLQPKPGMLDEQWVERFEQILHAADAIGMRPWACLQEDAVPRWFDNDGGFDDEENFTTWWPRWVERSADRFGDLVGGWVPFACVPAGAPPQPWVDTWGILAGGPPVVAAVDLRGQSGTLGWYESRMDLLGAVLVGDWDDDDDVGAARLASAVDRWGGELREAADAVDTSLVTSFSSGHHDSGVAGDIVAALRSTIDDACADGVPIEIAFLEPGIAGAGSSSGLLTVDRAPTPSSSAFLDR
jgi:hypothetical protein